MAGDGPFIVFEEKVQALVDVQPGDLLRRKNVFLIQALVAEVVEGNPGGPSYTCVSAHGGTFIPEHEPCAGPDVLLYTGLAIF